MNLSFFSRTIKESRGTRMADSGPHLDIELWLKKLDLPDYTRLFAKYGGVELCAYLLEVLYLGMYEMMKYVMHHVGKTQGRMSISRRDADFQITELSKESGSGVGYCPTNLTIRDILHFTERDLKTLGIRNGAHRARVMTAIVALREKYNKGANKKIGNGFSNKSNSCFNLSVYNGKPFWEQHSCPSSIRNSPASSAASSHRSSMEPVIGPNATPEELKTALEWELSLDWRDLRSHPWYHGTIPRHRAEQLVKQNGEFLVRDFVSRPGDYVLSCCWAGSPQHFIISKVIIQPNTIYERMQYQFDHNSAKGDSSFDTIPDLITYYVGNKSAVFPSLGVTISRPVNRTMPLSYYMSRFGLDCQMQYVARALGNTQNIPKRTPPPVPEDVTPVPPQLPQKTRGIILPKSEKVGDAPPKPSRIPSKKSNVKPKVNIRRLPSLEDNEDDFVDISVFTENTNGKGREHTPVIAKQSRKSSGETRFSFLDRKAVDIDYNKVKPFTIPPLDPPSAFDLSDYKTSLLGPENKPLEANAMCKVRNLLMESGSRILAAHLTKVDLDLLMHGRQVDLGLGVTSGVEMLLLPQGEQLRKDVIERMECMKSLLVITVLMCPTQTEMVDLLNKWISIAIETKVALGNLYGFAYIMQGIAHCQLARLKNIWLSLRRVYTENALHYETKLKPSLKAMQDCTSMQYPNMCIPYLPALVSIFDIPRKGNLEEETVELLDSPSELSSVDYGLEMLLNHLIYGRQVAQQCATYMRNGEAILDNIDYNNELLDIFRTEFHLKFLWGSRGATADPLQRHDKFLQLLTLLSKKLE